MISWLQHRWTGLYLVILALGSLILYLYGMFPIKYHTGHMAHWDDLPNSIDGVSIDPNEVYKPEETSVIIMIVDALRYDFVTEEGMPFTTGMVKNKSACIYVSVADPPTITSPRIKAMMTGSISTFSDMTFNLGARALCGDSVLRVAASRGRKTVLYGNNVWLSLFPGLWTEYDGTIGLFVTDFTEVDTNVTRHLDTILKPDENKKPPFDFLVLHYLGLDHIGHLEGIHGPKMKPKLLEMDNVVRRIFTAMGTWKHDVVFFMGGDHGMKDAGSHGGATPAEIFVPLVVAKSGFQCPHSGHEDTTVAQVDLTPTVSWLLGAPIPGDNTGRILPCLLPDDTRQHLYLLHYVAKHNAKAVHTQIGDIALEKEFYKRLREAEKQFAQFLSSRQESAAKLAKALYEESLTEMSVYLTKSTVDLDMFSIVMGICLMFAIAVALMCVTLFSLQPEDGRKCSVIYHGRRGSQAGTMLAFLIVASTTTVILFLSCAITETKSSTCSLNSPWIGVFGATALTFTITFFIIKAAVEYNMDLTFLNELNAKDVFIISASLFHSWTFFGTSLIQEEHMIWYFYWNTWMVFILIRTLVVVIEDFSKGTSQGDTEVRDKPALKMTKGLTMLSKWVMLIVLHRYLRSMNQTGDRWMSLSDTSDWLNKPEHSFYLKAHLLVGIVVTFIICIWNLRYTKNIFKLNSIFTILAILCLICYRIASEALSTPFEFIKTWDTVNIVNAFWVVLATQMVVEVLSFTGAFRKCGVKVTSDPNQGKHKNDEFEKTRDYIYVADTPKLNIVRSVSHLILNNTMLIILLLMRPHNVIMIPSLYVTCVLTSQCMDHSLLDMQQSKRKEVLDTLSQCLLHVWIGWLFFFYQGNSNNLATVDLGTGYVGLRSYCPYRVAPQLTLHTYAGPALAVINLFTSKAAVAESWEQYLRLVWRYTNILAAQRVYALVIYLIVAAIFRYHLLTWIVFAPKLVYDLGATMFTVFALVTIAVIIGISHVASCIASIVTLKTNFFKTTF